MLTKKIAVACEGQGIQRAEVSMTVSVVMPPDSLFPGFDLVDVKTPRGAVRARIGGQGAPLLLLHGYPQTHVMWHRVANVLKDRFRIICIDLPGYGDSFAPEISADHAPHSKRAMAQDIVAAMEVLGHASWYLGAHDRGARVAHRMALDHPDCVRRLATLDIAPTREMYAHTTDAFARAYWHWFFLITPPPFPERMIGLDPDTYWLAKCGAGSAGLNPFAPEALAEYLRCFRKPEVIAATCEDYRAAATIDIAHDDADGGRMVDCPLLALWGEHGIIGKVFDPLALWRARASDVTGLVLPGGHYLAEECPDLVAICLADFFQEPDRV
jgi:haloacetate dehalogenase